ncbi:hypothetical protein GIB67_029104 [Kingdonia uniflora]|uniref:Protein kinase domain-containing protein n=1 Tax=Kingdonia uniflora TaxID=39325 RepID=A0A7J7N6R5_9MAGN|nr:hypothetical protein GIB67_029104 [Kingdonia uniflora]
MELKAWNWNIFLVAVIISCIAQFVMLVHFAVVYFGLFIHPIDVVGILSILILMFLHFFGNDQLGPIDQPFFEGPREFLYNDLKRATNRFRNKLGSGGSGSVFQGILDDGTQIAVKRVERLINGDVWEYEREISVIASVEHAHLVRLLGYCHYMKDTGSISFIVYDFYPNGSLYSWISHTANDHNSRCLPWKLRCKVAIDVADALAYLHHDCHPQILHLDIKPENILLGDNFQAVLSDFGLSRLMIERKSIIITTIRGSDGYMAPEWFTGHGISEKCDVFSYALVILDLCFGYSGNVLYDSKGNRSNKGVLVLHSLEKVLREKGKVLELIDKRLAGDGEADENQARALLRVALSCLQEDPKKRPTMRWVVTMLEIGLCNEADRNNWVQSRSSDMLYPAHPHRSHPQHNLEFVNNERPYKCDGCREIGFGTRYRCEGCNFDLHKDCMLSTSSKDHPFYKKCDFKFLEQPPGESLRYCKACGSTIKGFMYHCSKYDRDLHPCCTNLPIKIKLNVVELRLSETDLSKCGLCGRKEVHKGVMWWSYASNKCNFHVFCIKEMLVKCWEKGYFGQGEGNNNLALEDRIPNLQQITLYANASIRWGGLNKYRRIQVIKFIASIILGDPIAGIVWLNESLFTA